MNDDAAGPQRSGLILYLAVAFGLSWTWLAPLLISGDVVGRGDGWPTHLPALLGPAVAAIVATAYERGTAGLRDLLGRLRNPGGKYLWAVALTLGVGAVAAVGQALVTGRTPPVADFWTYSGAARMNPLLLFASIFVVNGIGEELGWRGYLADHLLSRYGVVGAGLRTAVPWAAWHLPMFWTVSGLRDLGPSVVGWGLGLTAGSILLTWLYQRSGRSVLLVALWHTVFNFVSGTAGADGATAAVVSTGVMVAATAIVVASRRSTRARAATA